ncbi:hypothetical protein AQ505_12740 [Pedobacter sp. PACM 27299]|uniref:hypothetical protein n=1 Tax=Pedobacter sp. PACM 27299 TaxID=1727164 RepID=UPI000705D9C0|nr:hypothetical protein [Pedobacter sp. PACM 27299]ALL06286.1 hypothetical protein AQ505_12740 [Pedobacter sp. PACM 27299]
MVSLENRSIYLQTIESNGVLMAFKNLLWHKEIIRPSELNEIDTIYYGIIEAILTDSVVNFDIHYRSISRRTPTKDSISPFVHNDYLIFAIITGISKFKYDKNWIRQIIQIRTRNSTTITFENIVSENYYSKSNNPAIVITFLNIINKKAISKELQDDAYSEITQSIAIFDESNDFIALCFLNTYDSIIVSREIIDTKHHNFLLNFESTFIKRTKVISGVLYNLLLIMVIYGIYKTLNHYPQIKQEFADTVTIIGLIGLTVTNFITWIRTSFEKMIQKLLGYPNLH